MGFGAIADVEDLMQRCLSELIEPQADEATLRKLIAECSVSLTALVEERRSLRTMMRTRIEEIAALVASQGAVWPEDVARLEALSEDIRSRAAALE